MATDLDTLLELARQKPVSAAERETQRISFAYGNAKMSNVRVTKESIERAALELTRSPVTVVKK